MAAIGSEAVALGISDVIWGSNMTVEDLPALNEHVFEGFLMGLRDAGWQGDRRLVRLGYVAAVALRFGPLLGWPTIVDANDQQRESANRILGHPLEELLDRHGRCAPFILNRAKRGTSPQRVHQVSSPTCVKRKSRH